MVQTSPFSLILRYAEKRAGNRKTRNNVSDLSDRRSVLRFWNEIAIVSSVNLGLDCDVDFINLKTEILFAFLNFFLNLDLINLIICKRKNNNINFTSLHSG